jgi:hypothetical protein
MLYIQRMLSADDSAQHIGMNSSTIVCNSASGDEGIGF